MLGSIVLLSSADGMKRSPSLDGEALRAYDSVDVIKDDDGNDLDSKEAAVLRYRTREALDALKNSEESDKAAIERLSQGNEKINEEELDKLSNRWRVQIEGSKYQDIVNDVSSYINDEDTGATYLKEAVEALGLGADATLQNVIEKITAQKSLITREELFSKRDEKVRAEKEAAEKALQEALDGKDEAVKALQEAVGGKDEAVKALQEAVDGKDEAVKALQAVVAEKDEAKTEAAAWRLKIKEKNDKIKELEAALEQAQNAPKAQESTEDQVKETQENVDDDIPVVKLDGKTSGQNDVKAKEPAKAQTPAPKATEAPAQKPTKVQKPADAPRGAKYK